MAPHLSGNFRFLRTQSTLGTSSVRYYDNSGTGFRAPVLTSPRMERRHTHKRGEDASRPAVTPRALVPRGGTKWFAKLRSPTYEEAPSAMTLKGR